MLPEKLFMFLAKIVSNEIDTYSSSVCDDDHHSDELSFYYWHFVYIEMRWKIWLMSNC